jgi:tRNA modification GTPase
MPVVLTDTAGVRRTCDTVETIGIERANRAIADADLVLLVIDGSVELTEEDRELFSQIRDSRYLVIANKSDLPQFEEGRTPKHLGDANVVQVSALLGSGLDRLHEAILDQLGFREHVAEGLLITDARHYDLLCRSIEQLQAAIAALADRVTEELVLVNLHNALTLLGAITGETTAEDILTQIFQTFCIGK